MKHELIKQRLCSKQVEVEVPLKQGLKLGCDIKADYFVDGWSRSSIKTRIETCICLLLFEYILGWSRSSIKTRIETLFFSHIISPLIGWSRSSIKTRIETYVGKLLVFILITVEVEVPLKQGLKLCRQGTKGLGQYGWSRSSIKTRIETN